MHNLHHNDQPGMANIMWLLSSTLGEGTHNPSAYAANKQIISDTVKQVELNKKLPYQIPSEVW